MPLLTGIDASMLGERQSTSNAVARKVPLVHVDANVIDLIENPPHQIPTYATGGKSKNTHRTETLLALGPSAYFYAGRAHPQFGNTALAFAAGCEAGHTGSASPFDTGGLLSSPPHLKIRLNPTDGEAERVEFGMASLLPLDDWRGTFCTFLAAYFESYVHYWQKKPNRHDPEGLVELNEDWRAWTFEIRFSQGHEIAERVAWCADEIMMNELRRMVDDAPPTIPGDPPSFLDQFLAGPPALEPAGTILFCTRLEQWVQEQVAV